MCSLGVGELSVCVGVGCETSPGLVVTDCTPISL